MADKEKLVRELLARQRAAEAAASSPTAPVPQTPNEGIISELMGRNAAAQQAAENAPPPPEVEGKTSNMESLLTGMQDTATVGNTGPYRAGREQAAQSLDQLLPFSPAINSALTKYSPLAMVPEAAGAVNAGANLITGEPIINSDEQEAAVDKALSDNPYMALAGQFGGAIVPATGTARGVMFVVDKGAKGLPAIRTAANFMGNTKIGRFLTSAAAGGLEGGAYAKSKDQNVGLGSALGVAGAGAGSILAGAIGSTARAISGSNSYTAARKFLGDEIKRVTRSEASPEGVIGVDAGATVRPSSTLMDVNKGAEEVMTTMMRSPPDVGDFWKARNLLTERMDKATGSLQDFEQTMVSSLPKGFTRQAGNIGDPRAADTVLSNAKSYYSSLQNEFGTVLDNAKGLAFNEKQLSAELKDAIIGNNPKPDEGIREAWATIANIAKTEKPSDARGMYNLRKAIDHRIDDTFSPTASAVDKSKRRGLILARNIVHEKLDAIPGFAEANAKYATEASYLRAYDVGSKIMSDSKKALSPEALEDYMNAANPGDMQGFWEGVSREIIDSLAKAGGEGRMLKKITKDDRIAKKLHTIFPQTADAMIEAANKAVDETATANAVLSGSRTSLDAARKERMNQSSKLLDKMLVGLGAVNIATQGKRGGSLAGAGGALRRLLPKETDPAFNREVERLLLAQGPEGINRALGQMQSTQDIFRLPISLGGVDRALAAQAGELSGENALLRMTNPLTTYDLGVTVPSMLGTVPRSLLNNAPGSMEQREDDRARRRYERNKQ